MYLYTCICTYVCIYVYIYTYSYVSAHMHPVPMQYISAILSVAAQNHR